jgi:hypothetical protein
MKSYGTQNQVGLMNDVTIFQHYFNYFVAHFFHSYPGKETKEQD